MTKKVSDFGDNEFFLRDDGSFICWCESSFCAHSSDENGRFHRCEGRPTDEHGAVMLFLGPVCEDCAKTCLEHDGASYLLVPIGIATEYIG